MSSAILLISVVCCGFLHAIPYHGKRSIETDNYDYEDSDENESYDQPSMPGHRGMGDDDMAMAFFEDTVEKYEAKNGNTSQNHQFSRRSNQGNLEDAEMTINEGLPLLAGYSAENREDNDLSGSLKKSEKSSEVAELRRATVEPEGISEGPVEVLTKALKLQDPANLLTENLKVKAEILAATVDPLKIISEFRERIAAPSKSTESTTLTADPLTESSESPSDPVNKVTPVLWEKSLEVSEEEFQVANVRSKEPFYSLSFSSNSSVQPKYTASVRSKNNLTLCWIETITIKEDNATSPAMRLVLREYTITLENSVSIPEDLLEYSGLEGEVHPVTKEKAMNTPFQEFFSNETQRSQVTKLKKITQEGNLMVTEEKTMRCGTGSFITKNIYERLDASNKPVKRVEIKVGPVLKSIKDDVEGTKTPTEFQEAPTSEQFADGLVRLGDDLLSCQPGDKDCVKSMVDPDSRALDQNPSAISVVPEGLICDASTGTCTSTEFTERITVTPFDRSETVSEVTTQREPANELGIGIIEGTKREETVGLLKEAEEEDASTTLLRRADLRKSRYVLKLQVVVERIDENDNRETVINLEKEVPLNHTNETYMEQLDALNDTVNDIDVVRDLLKDSAFEGISPVVWESFRSSTGASVHGMTRPRRSLPVDLRDAVKNEIVEECLPDISADISRGLTEIKSQISEADNGDLLSNEDLSVKADFERKEFPRPRTNADVEDVQVVSRWSHERSKQAFDGGDIRSFTELLILENSEVV